METNFERYDVRPEFMKNTILIPSECQLELSSSKRRWEEEMVTSKRRWEEAMDDLRHKTKAQISDLEFAKSSLERQRQSLEDELTSKQHEIAGLKMTVSQLTSAQEGIKAELEATKVYTVKLYTVISSLYEYGLFLEIHSKINDDCSALIVSGVFVYDN